MSEHLVFVYGSLKKGKRLSSVLAGSTHVGDGRTAEAYGLYNLGAFPGLTEEGEKKASVRGELYRVTNDVLDQLDRIEGHPSFYKRTNVPIIMNHMAERIEAGLYIFQGESLPDPISPQEDGTLVWE